MSAADQTRQLKKELETAAKVQDPLKRNLLVLGIITKGLGKYRPRPVLVGGRAVEFYTLGEYRTFDNDLVCRHLEELKILLKELGFERTGRHWYLEKTDTAIETPSTYLSGDEKLVKRVRIGKYVVSVIGIEDLVVDRLNACIHWRSELDCEQATALIATHFDEINWDYLRDRARKSGTKRKLEELVKKARKV